MLGHSPLRRVVVNFPTRRKCVHNIVKAWRGLQQCLGVLMTWLTSNRHNWQWQVLERNSAVLWLRAWLDEVWSAYWRSLYGLRSSFAIYLAVLRLMYYSVCWLSPVDPCQSLEPKRDPSTAACFAPARLIRHESACCRAVTRESLWPPIVLWLSTFNFRRRRHRGVVPASDSSPYTSIILTVDVDWRCQRVTERVSGVAS